MRLDLIQTTYMPCLVFLLLCATKWGICGMRNQMEIWFTMRSKGGWGVALFWHGFCERGATTHARVQPLLDSSNPNHFDAKIKGFFPFVHEREISEKCFHGESIWAWLMAWEKEESPLLFGWAKPRILGFVPKGLGREKRREKSVSSPYFFHILISSRCPFSISKKVWEIWRKDPD